MTGSATELVFRDDPYAASCDATITAVTPRGGVVLDRTVFYPTGGGQPGDSGVLRFADGSEIAIATTVATTVATVQQQMIYGGFRLHQPMSVSIVTPGNTQIFGCRSQRSANLGICATRFMTPYEGSHARDMRCCHRRAVEESIVARFDGHARSLTELRTECRAVGIRYADRRNGRGHATQCS